MDRAVIESLLNDNENSALDFKREQYPFDGANEDQKSELIKDILALTNSWRRTEGYILIGVEESRGARSKPVGVKKHLEEAHLQQLVNAKTNRPVEFTYEVLIVDAVEIGVIRIPLQERPVYVTKDFGKLKKHAVYLRRGSATDVADPDEVAQMGAARFEIDRQPKLSVVGRVVHNHGHPQGHPQILISIKNEPDAGTARAPHLSFEGMTAAFQPSQWGLDGKGTTGLPKIPETAGSRQPDFIGDTTTVIHAGTERKVTCIDYVGDPAKRPSLLRLEYQLVAEGIEAVLGTIEVPLQ